MARSVQVGVGPGAAVLLADETKGGGLSVTLLNPHASVDCLIGGDENQITGQTGYGTTLGTNSGFRLAAGKTLSLVLDGNEQLWGLSTNATVTLSIHVFRANVAQPMNFA